MKQEESKLPGVTYDRSGRPKLPLPMENGVGLLSAIFALSIPFIAIFAPRDAHIQCAIENLPSVRPILANDPTFASVICRAQAMLEVLAIARFLIIAVGFWFYISKYSRLYSAAWRAASLAKKQCFFY